MPSRPALQAFSAPIDQGSSDRKVRICLSKTQFTLPASCSGLSRCRQFLFEFLDEWTKHLLKCYRPINQPIEQHRNARFIVNIRILFSLDGTAGLFRFDPFQLGTELLRSEE